jgi:6-phosphogluconolactonase (cycloisomerase 2 family)
LSKSSCSRRKSQNSRSAACALTSERSLDGTLTPISSSVPTLGSANCWNVASPDGRFVYVSNAGSGSISGFAIGQGGTLTALPGTVLASNPAGSSNIDSTLSADGKFLYTLNAGTGAVGMFAVQGQNRSPLAHRRRHPPAGIVQLH